MQVNFITMDTGNQITVEGETLALVDFLEKGMVYAIDERASVELDPERADELDWARTRCRHLQAAVDVLTIDDERAMLSIDPCVAGDLLFYLLRVAAEALHDLSDKFINARGAMTRQDLLNLRKLLTELSSYQSLLEQVWVGEPLSIS